MKITARPGFTLVELLIVVTIIAIATGATVPAFSAYIRSQNLVQAREIMKSDFRSLQNRALTGSMSDTLIGGVKMQYWAARLGPGASTYDFFLSSNLTCPAAWAANQFQGTSTTFPTGIVTRNAATCCVFFNIDNGDISNTCGSPMYIGYSNTERLPLNLSSNGLIY